ncbi:hypothetical protein [Haloquadratum walsbyi]|uniref:hypothetical protein n=1 Tax=Haloquadratum walsbyi TaxID=293091 RepID=UPI000A79E7BE|nr:hypothetical protein [Haloquadratum walsbyi]
MRVKIISTPVPIPMRSRRTALIGVGSLLAGVGGLLGTTAFSSVEANRTASV